MKDKLWDSGFTFFETGTHAQRSHAHQTRLYGRPCYLAVTCVCSFQVLSFTTSRTGMSSARLCHCF